MKREARGEGSEEGEVRCKDLQQGDEDVMCVLLSTRYFSLFRLFFALRPHALRLTNPKCFSVIGDESFRFQFSV